MPAATFPITPLLPELIASLGRTPRLVLEAPPGAGKTTQVPLALLDAEWLEGGVLMLEPRRIAARAAAEFMARQLGEPVGERVGYRVRFDSRVGPRTRVEVVTEAILTRRIQQDSALEGVGALIFDEFHERHLQSDLGLVLAREVQATLRPELRLLVMSATLDGERVARWLDAPRLTSAGRSFPVEVSHVPPTGREDEAFALRRAVLRALAETDGDVLVFLPGKAEIERARRMLEGAVDPAIALLPLHGELELEAQRAVLAPPPPGVRRVVLATNVAESSVTLPAVRAVVDTGLVRAPRFDPGSGMTRLVTESVSQASATQRAGRAGRAAAGRCWRLWPESQRLEPATAPEIARVELMPLALELAAWGSGELDWLDPPPTAPLAEARERLREFGAIDARGAITAHGRALLALPAHPRLAHLVLKVREEELTPACALAAVLEGRELLRGEARREVDLRVRLAAGAGHASVEVDRGALAQVRQAAGQLVRAARAQRSGLPPLLQEGPSAAPASRTGTGFAASVAEHAGEWLALAWPERIARHDGGTRYRLANGRGARLHDESSLRGSAWLVVAELRFDARDSLITRAAPIDEAALRARFPQRFVRGTEVGYDEGSRAVVAREVERFGAIELSSRSVPAPRDAASAARLLEAVRALGIEALPWSESLRQWQARVETLRGAVPELSLPAVDDAALAATLDEWLAPLLAGKVRLAELDETTLREALLARLDHAQRRALDNDAPVQLTLPSGNARRLDYTRDGPPVLAVKLQELFGLADTPRIARGRVAVMLHLLSPAQRPIQVTQDLRSFWSRTYPEVRRELKGRYPRHPWPEDPWNAVATARVKPRGT